RGSRQRGRLRSGIKYSGIKYSGIKYFIQRRARCSRQCQRRSTEEPWFGSRGKLKRQTEPL
ncbi:MAG: hypothetical protein ACK557_07330, partial [Planctomycetota bacterium]